MHYNLSVPSGSVSSLTPMGWDPAGRSVSPGGKQCWRADCGPGLWMEKRGTSAQQAGAAISGQMQLRPSLCRGRRLFLYLGSEAGTLEVALGGCYLFIASASDALSTPVLRYTGFLQPILSSEQTLSFRSRGLRSCSGEGISCLRPMLVLCVYEDI